MKADAAKGGAGTLKKRLTRDWNMNKWKYVMIIPVLVYLALFCYKPMYGLIIAFKDYKITRGDPGLILGKSLVQMVCQFRHGSLFPACYQEYIPAQRADDHLQLPRADSSGASHK